MLQNIRDNSRGWIAKVIIGLIVILMAFTGFEAIVTGTSNRNNAAEVNGDTITLNELNQAVEMQRRQLLQQLGRDFDPSLLDDKLLREAALKGLIDRKLLLQGAKDAGFAFSQPALDQVILQTPEFQTDGRFDSARFDQVIRQMGYTRLQFRQMLEEEMLIGQLRAGIGASSFVTEDQARAYASLERQTRDFASFTVKADPAAIKVADDEVKAYYDEHASEFMSPEQVVLEYVQLDKERLFDQVKVTDEELQPLYQSEIANLAEQRDAAHILIEGDDDAAKQKIEEIKARIDAGEDFAALAKEFSQDPGSAANGGDLGYAGPGVYDPAFEQALYALKQGEVSAPVKSPFGWHLIKLLGVQSPEVPSFASIRDKLARDYKEQQVEKRFVELSKELEDSAFESADLTQPAQELGLEVKVTEPFGREGGSSGITANRQVLQAAFSPEVLEDGANSSTIELDPSNVVVVRLKQHLKPEQLPLEQVAESIRSHLAQERATAAAKTEGERLLAAVKAGDEKAQAWALQEAVTRSQEGVEPKVLQALFRMAKPESKDAPSYAGVVLNNGDYVVLRLDGVSVPEGALSEQELAMYRNFLASREGQQDFAAYRKQLQDKADIERF
ncbi:SurA N-terminal domain-containing protein [Pseudomonas sp. GOM7]|uniref:SurA N-terminal domain-containing protein n=1 Tax=unclassified Pseudomonas TaxID=196821 RepID=UPI00227B5C6D|nr:MULTISPECIES: SurA N-terminal domain-containing protein [unclassified Pseudomonas]WAJ39750.1 SurA N-terminal domain-containing protein [Pseudomonas sp. GOM7]